MGRKLTGDRLATLNEFIADIKADMASFEQVSNEQKQRVESLFDQFASAIAAINEQKGDKLRSLTPWRLKPWMPLVTYSTVTCGC